MSFDAPQSRNEAILQNILGANNELGEPQSRIEDLLMQLLENGVTPESVEVEGATAEIEVAENTIYRCGTMTSLTIESVPDTGESTIIFLSGATPTTLTLPEGLVMPDGFEVEANKRYEVNILDKYAVAASWTVSA